MTRYPIIRLVPEEENEENDRDRNPQKPKQNTATHDNLPPELLANWIDLELLQSDASSWVYNQDLASLFLAEGFEFTIFNIVFQSAWV